MSEATNDFENQVKLFEKKVLEAINDYPELSSYILGSVTLLPKEEEEEEIKENAFKIADNAFFTESDIKHRFKNSLINIRPRRCKINGQPYYGYPCPWHGLQG